MDKKEIIKYLMQNLSNFTNDEYKNSYASEIYGMATNDILKKIIGTEKYKLKDFIKLFDYFPLEIHLYFDKFSENTKYYCNFYESRKIINEDEYIERFFDYNVVEFCVSGGSKDGCVRITIEKENNIEDKNNKAVSTNSHFSLNNKITLKEFLNMYNVPENKVCGIVLNEVKSDELLFCYRNVIISKILNNNIVLNYKNYFVKSFGFDKDILVINIYE